MALRQAALLAITALLLAGCGEPAASGAGGTSTRVVRVIDGDTVELSGLGSTRLIGVDTPEVYGGVECYGRAASAFTGRVLKPGTRVTYRLGVDDRDRYGRVLAYVWLRDGTFFNELLVERGYATPLTIPPNAGYERRFVAAARRARDAGRGLWHACDDGGITAP